MSVYNGFTFFIFALFYSIVLWDRLVELKPNQSQLDFLTVCLYEIIFHKLNK